MSNRSFGTQASLEARDVAAPEGVRIAIDDSHLARLRTAGCDIGQEHLLGRPLPGDQVVSTAHALRAWVPDASAGGTPFLRAG